MLTILHETSTNHFTVWTQTESCWYNKFSQDINLTIYRVLMWEWAEVNLLRNNRSINHFQTLGQGYNEENIGYPQAPLYSQFSPIEKNCDPTPFLNFDFHHKVNHRIANTVLISLPKHFWGRNNDSSLFKVQIISRLSYCWNDTGKLCWILIHIQL